MKAALLFVQPTVIVPPLLTKVAPMFTTTPAAFATEVTVTVCPVEITTLLLHDGTTPPTHVEAVFQSPVAADVIAVEVFIFEASLIPI